MKEDVEERGIDVIGIKEKIVRKMRKVERKKIIV